MGGNDRAVSGQRLCRHVPAATYTKVTIEELCFICGPCRDVISKEQGETKFNSVREAMKKRVIFKSPQLKVRL
jgi:hypothetical protein